LLANTEQYQKVNSSYQYIPNLWIVFFPCSDWLLKLGIVSAIHLQASFSEIHTRVFPHFSEKWELFGAGYPIVWYIIIFFIVTSSGLLLSKLYGTCN